MKKRIYLTLIIFSCLIILIIVFFIFPFLSRIKNNSQELALQKEKMINLEAKINNLGKFRDLGTDLEQFLKEIDNLFVDAEVPVDFINFLEKTSEKCGLSIEILPISDKEAKNFWPCINFKIISIGSFPDFLMFLEKLENNPYLLEIQNITISRLAEKEDISSKNIRADFSLKVFVKPY